jgi:hypothetical protein
VAGFCVRKATFLAAQLQFLSSQASHLVVVASFFLFVPATVFAGFPPVVVGHVAAARRGCPISRRCAPLGPTNRETHRPAVTGKYGGLGPPWGTGNRSRGAPRAAAEPREHGRLARSTPVLRETPWMLDSAKDLAHLPLTHPGGRVPRPPKGHTSRDCSRPPPNREQKSCHAARHAPYPSRPSSFVLFFLVLLPGKSRRPARCLRNYCPVPK